MISSYHDLKHPYVRNPVLTRITRGDTLRPPQGFRGFLQAEETRFNLDGEGYVRNVPSVLIVDASHESREVLRLLLEHRGAKTIEADRPEEAVRLAGRCRPDLIILDAESDESPTGEPTNDLRQVASRNDTPIVILGKVRQPGGPFPPGEFVAKPYHYGPLIRKIYGLLAAA